MIVFIIVVDIDIVVDDIDIIIDIDMIIIDMIIIDMIVFHVVFDINTYNLLTLYYMLLLLINRLDFIIL